MRAQTPGGRIPVHEFGAARRWAGASGAHCRIWAQCIWSVLAFAMRMTCMRAAGLGRALGPPLPAACPPRAALVARWALLRSLSAQSLDTRSWPLALGEATTLVATRARRSEKLPAPAHKHLPPPQARAKERSSQAGGAAAAMPVRSRRRATLGPTIVLPRSCWTFHFLNFRVQRLPLDLELPSLVMSLVHECMSVTCRTCLDRHRTNPSSTPCGKSWRTSVLSCSRMVPTPS